MKKKKPFFKRLFSSESHDTGEDNSREYIAEQLEARILYSAAPAPVEAPEQLQHELVEKTESPNFESIDAFANEAVADDGSSQSNVLSTDIENDVLVLSSFDNLSQEEIELLAGKAYDQWSQLDLDAKDLEALEAIEISMVDIEALALDSDDDLWLDGIVEGAGELAQSSTAHREVDLLTQSTLDIINEAAQQRWSSFGLTEEQEVALDEISISIGDLENNALGSTLGNVIRIDDDAAGRGWFIDATPLVDEEFFGSGSQLFAFQESTAYGLTDLLTVVMHEQGHILGLTDHAEVRSDLMFSHTGVNERRLPTAELAENADPDNQLDQVQYATSTTVQTNADTVGGVQTSLRDAIIEIESLDGTGGVHTINLAAETYTLSIGGQEDNAAQGDLDIRNRLVDVVIQGAGDGSTIIDANGIDRVFQIYEGSKVHFKDLTIQGGNITNSHGAGVYVDNADVTFENVTITKNSASTHQDRYGAGFYAQGIDASVTLLGTVNITDNSAAGYGGGFFANQHVTIDGSGATAINITGNASGNDGKGFTRTDRDGGGFAASEHSKVTLAKAKIDGNGDSTTGRDGGGFWVAANAEVTLTDSEITNNVAREDGGGFFQQDRTIVNLTNTKIESNTATVGHGAGFRTISAMTETYITGGSLTANRAAGDGSHGGGFWNQGKVEITGIDITNNVAGNQGGGFYNSYQGANITLTDVNITNNTSEDGGGGFFNHRGSVEFKLDSNTQTNISDNRTGLDTDGSTTVDDRHGGGFYTQGTGASVTIANGFLENNTSTGHAGGIYAGGESVVTITGDAGNKGQIANNKMNQTRGDRSGGGILVTDAANVSLTNVDIKGHTARQYGGGVSQHTGSSVFTMTNGEISGNQSNAALNNNNSFGGGLWSIGKVNLTDVTVTGNEALGEANENVYGGGLALETGGAVGTFSNVDLKSNAAWHHGGGFWFNDATVNWTGGEISANTVGKQDGVDSVGGGGMIVGESNITLKDVTTKSHTIESHGGGFYLTNRSILTIDGGEVSGNLAGILDDGTVVQNGADGGGIYATEDSRLVLKNGVKIQENVSEEHGGGFYIASDRTIVQIEGADIMSNTASSGEGGGFNNVGGVVLFSGTTNITNNVTTKGDENTDSHNVGGGFRTSGGIQGC